MENILTFIIKRLYNRTPVDYYVYTHSKPNGEVFYVGKGIGNRATVTRNRGKFWNRVANKYGVHVRIVMDGLQEWAAIELEQNMISLYGRRDTNSGTLVNLTDGGDGVSGYKRTAEMIEKVAAANRGKTWTENQRKLYSDSYEQRKDELRFNPSDKTVYTFVNKTGEIFKGTRLQFKDKFRFDPRSIFSARKTHCIRDWGVCRDGESVEDCLYRVINSRRISLLDNNKYVFKNKDGTEFIGTRRELCYQYNLCLTQINHLFKKVNPNKSIKGWSLSNSSKE